jgi:hypothetical protein
MCAHLVIVERAIAFGSVDQNRLNCGTVTLFGTGA